MSRTQGHPLARGNGLRALRLAGLLAGTGITLALGARVAFSAEPGSAKAVQCWRGKIDVEAHLIPIVGTYCHTDARTWEGHAEVQLREERETRTVPTMSVDGEIITEVESTADLWYDWVEWSVKQDPWRNECEQSPLEHDGFDYSGRMDSGPERTKLGQSGTIYYQSPEALAEARGIRPRQYILNRLPVVCDSGNEWLDSSCNFGSHFRRGVGPGFKGGRCDDEARFLSEWHFWEPDKQVAMEGQFICDLLEADARTSSGSISVTWSLEKVVECENAFVLRQFR